MSIDWEVIIPVKRLVDAKALLRCLVAGHAKPRLGDCCGQIASLEFADCGGQAERGRGVDCQLVMATAKVLDERVASDHDTRRSMGLQSTHWSEPGLEPAVVAFDPVVLVLARCYA